MFFGKRDKKTPTGRVEDLKARVDALRQADQATRKQPLSLDHFLEGDDVLTGREVEDHYQPSGFSPDKGPADHTNDDEAALAAELEKYIKREEERALKKEPPAGLPPGGKEPAPPESVSLLMDGTWSRDADRRPNVSAADRAWGAAGVPQPRTLPSGETPVSPFEAGADWNDPEQSAPDELPPREEAV